tara:strand:+ start:10361 stop:11614 length:1254 start_codon:yes stop_codon:yes gene_type:complete
MKKNNIIHVGRKLETILRVDIDYIVKGGFFLSIAQFFSMGIGLVMSIAFANLLDPTTYGQYKYVISAALILGSLTLTTGLGTSIIQGVAKGYEGNLNVAFFKNLFWSLGMFALSLVTATYYWLNDNTFLALSFIVIAFTVPLTSSASFYRVFLNGKKEFKNLTMDVIIQKSVTAFAVIGAMLLTNNPLTIVCVFFASELITPLFFYLHTLKKYKPNDKTDINENKSYSMHLSIMNIMKNVSGQMDKILIFQWIGAAQLATYSIALAPVTEISGVDKMLSTLALPKLSQRTYKEIRATLLRKIIFLMAIMGIFTFVYILATPFIFGFLFPQYTNAVLYSQLLALTVVLSPAIIITKAFIAHKKIIELYLMRFTVPLVQVTSLVYFLPKFGLIGAVTSILITKVFWFILVVTLFIRTRG